MNEDKTAEANGSRSFEERVFARFDAVDNRLNVMDIRIENLEMKQYDTKPLWENALAAIADTNVLVRTGFDEVRAELGALNERSKSHDARFDSIDSRFDSIDARFDSIDAKFEAIDAGLTKQDTDLDNGLRGVERKIDVLNQNILDLRADQRYVDSRLEKIESLAKPS